MIVGAIAGAYFGYQFATTGSHTLERNANTENTKIDNQNSPNNTTNELSNVTTKPNEDKNTISPLIQDTAHDVYVLKECDLAIRFAKEFYNDGQNKANTAVLIPSKSEDLYSESPSLLGRAYLVSDTALPFVSLPATSIECYESGTSFDKFNNAFKVANTGKQGIFKK